MRVFFDSSAFAKRYIEEDGSEQVLQWCDKATELALSVIAVPELISASCRLRRERRLTARQYERIKANLLADITDAVICDTSPGAIRHAVRALETQALRGMDAIHIGAALECQAEAFITSDARQSKAARALGLAVSFV